MEYPRPELDNTVNYLEASYFSSSFIVYTRPNKSLIVVISGADQHVYTTCIKVKHKRVVVDVESSVDVVYKLKESHLSRSQVAYKRKHLVHLNRLMENMLWTFTLVTIKFGVYA